MRAWKSGRVAIANAPGAGVADDKVVYAWVPDLVRYYLGEEPLIANVPTHRCLYADERAFVLDNLRELVVKPANESGGYGIVIGNRATDAQLADGGRRRSPRIHATGSPSRSSSSRRRRRSARRASNHATSISARSSSPGATSYVTAGGLTRVALVEGLADRQLLARRGQQGHVDRRGRRRRNRTSHRCRGRADVLLSRVADDIYWAARYLERAEDTARVVRAHAETAADLPGRSAAHWKPLITVVGQRRPVRRTLRWRQLGGGGRRVPAVRPAQPGQRRALRVGRPGEPAHDRETIPTEGWQAVNDLYHYVNVEADRGADRRARDRFTRHVVSDSRRIDGILATTMSHDEAYAMWRLGRALERADMTTRVLGVRAAAVLIGTGEDRAGLRRPAVDGRAQVAVGPADVPARRPAPDRGTGRRPLPARARPLPACRARPAPRDPPRPRRAARPERAVRRGRCRRRRRARRRRPTTSTGPRSTTRWRRCRTPSPSSTGGSTSATSRRNVGMTVRWTLARPADERSTGADPPAGRSRPRARRVERRTPRSRDERAPPAVARRPGAVRSRRGDVRASGDRHRRARRGDGAHPRRPLRAAHARRRRRRPRRGAELDDALPASARSGSPPPRRWLTTYAADVVAARRRDVAHRPGPRRRADRDRVRPARPRGDAAGGRARSRRRRGARSPALPAELAPRPRRQHRRRQPAHRAAQRWRRARRLRGGLPARPAARVHLDRAARPRRASGPPVVAHARRARSDRRRVPAHRRRRDRPDRAGAPGGAGVPGLLSAVAERGVVLANAHGCGAARGRRRWRRSGRRPRRRSPARRCVCPARRRGTDGAAAHGAGVPRAASSQ